MGINAFEETPSATLGKTSCFSLGHSNAPVSLCHKDESGTRGPGWAFFKWAPERKVIGLYFRHGFNGVRRQK